MISLDYTTDPGLDQQSAWKRDDFPGNMDLRGRNRVVRRCCRMLSPVIYLVMNGLFFTLRLSGGSGSFPRPLKAAEEREYLQKCAQGDLEARNILVEHNLRLVAHIVKNG